MYRNLTSKQQRQMETIIARACMHAESEYNFHLNSVITLAKWYHERVNLAFFDRIKLAGQLGNKNLVHKFNLVCQEVSLFLRDNRLQSLNENDMIRLCEQIDHQL